MTDPAVTVLLPFRNAAPTLQEALDSVSRQTLPGFEVLGVDDHSDDDSPALFARRARRDPRFRLLASPARGLVPALNAGLAAARAPLVARMDADDRMLPERLERQLAFLRAHPGVSLVGTATRPFPPTLVSDGFRRYVDWQNRCNDPDRIADEIYIESPFAHPSVMYRKAAVTGIGGYRDGPFPEDYELWLRLHHEGHRLAKLPERLLEWREHPGRASRTDPRYSREAFDRLRAAYLAMDGRLRARADNFVVWGAGRVTRKRCRHLLERGFRPTAWVDVDPRKIGNRLNGVPVVGPGWLDRGERPLVLVYVAAHGARELIAEELESRGYRRGRDYLAVG